jgi:hypothetical protein
LCNLPYGMVAHDEQGQRFVHEAQKTVNNSLCAARNRCFIATDLGIAGVARGSTGIGMPGWMHCASRRMRVPFCVQAHKTCGRCIFGMWVF